MSSESARKEFRELMQIIRKKGFKVVPGGGHYKIIHGKGPQQGQKVRDENGPVILSSSPSDFRARDLAVARLIRAKVLSKGDLPWVPQQPKEADEGLLLGRTDPQVAEKKVAQERAKDANRSAHERTQMIRARLEPLLAQLGGWTKRGMVTELADVSFDYGREAPHGHKAKAEALRTVNNLKKGGTLSEDAATLWEAILDDIERADDIRMRWFDLVREARGLPPRGVPVFAQPSRSVVDPDADETRPLLTPLPGALNREMERQRGERYSDEEHPVMEFHRNGGVRWYADFTIDDLNELNRALGVFEGVAVQIGVFEGGEYVEAACERLRRIVEKVGEARHNELKGRSA